MPPLCDPHLAMCTGRASLIELLFPTVRMAKHFPLTLQNLLALRSKRVAPRVNLGTWSPKWLTLAPFPTATETPLEHGQLALTLSETLLALSCEGTHRPTQSEFLLKKKTLPLHPLGPLTFAFA